MGRNELADALVPGASPGRIKWASALKRAKDAAPPTPKCGDVICVRGKDIVAAVSILMGDDLSGFLQACEHQLRGLLSRCDVAPDSLDKALNADRCARQAAKAAREAAAAVVIVPYEFKNQALHLNGSPVKMFFFGDKPDFPWFLARPLHEFMGTQIISHTLERVHDDDKAKLHELIAAKGQPLGSPVLTRYELGSWVVNESGLYAMSLGSTKTHMRPFRRWVTSEVLPQIRRTGRYDAAIREIDRVEQTVGEARCVGENSPGQESPVKKAKKIVPALEEEFVPLSDVVAEVTTHKKGSFDFQVFLLQAFKTFKEMLAREGRYVDDRTARERYRMTLAGTQARIPRGEVALLRGAAQSILQREVFGEVIPARADPEESVEVASLPANRAAGYKTTGATHASMKDYVNAEFVALLLSGNRLESLGSVVVLDAFDGETSFCLRSTEALLRAGVPAFHIMSANPDEGICRHLLRLGVNAFHGMLVDAPFLDEACISGAFLDFCTGSLQKIEQTLMAILPRCLPGAVVGVTMLGRDFSGQDFTLRAFGVADFFLDKAWRPAKAGLLSKSAILYKSGGRQKVMTHFWSKP